MTVHAQIEYTPFSPQIAIADLQRYVEFKGFVLSEPAETLFVEAEAIGARLNVDLSHQVFLVALINRFYPLRSLMLRQEVSPEDAVLSLERQLSSDKLDEYTAESLYSREDCRVAGRQELIDGSMAIAWGRGRTEILAADVLEALMEAHDGMTPPLQNAEWSDERLHVPFNTLSHIKGRYDPDLWISFDDIRRELALLTPSAARRLPLDQAPSRLKSAVLSLLADNPDYLANCFIIMPFHSTAFHSEIVSCLRMTLRGLGFNPLRADGKAYSEDVMVNIEAYLYGCRFAVAVHDRFLSDDHNANVALEVGYCMGMKKPLCLLKEKSVKALPSDLQGRIYVSFDGTRIEKSLNSALKKWLSDNRITR